MTRWLHRPCEPARLLDCVAALVWLLAARPLAAQAPNTTAPAQVPAQPPAAIENRLRQLERRQAELLEQNRRLSARLNELVDQNGGKSPAFFNFDEPLPSAGGLKATGPKSAFDFTGLDDPESDPPEAAILPVRGEDHTDELPAPVWRPGAPSPDGLGSDGSTGYSVGYDKGFFIAPTDADEFPFSFKFNNQTQVRYTAFDAGEARWTDSTGAVIPITDRSNFEIPRGRAVFSGFVFLPDLTWMLNIDYNTVTDSPVNFRAYWMAYTFNRGLTLYLGQNKVPGSREWLVSNMNMLGPDRSMATTFFRPSLSQGIWATGEPIDGLFYHAMISNGFNTLNTKPSELDSRMAFSLSVWDEPWGEFGAGYGDFDWHEEPALRFGTSLTYSPEHGQQGDPNAPENAAIRLTDGTILTAPGALAPGVTLNIYYVGLETFDVSYKYRGFSISGEFYLQQLFGLRGNGPLPVSSLFAYGGFLQTGYFVIPQKFELYGRTSQITGRNGNGGEFAAGFNWFFFPGKQNLRYTLDAAWVERSPADQNRTDYRAGDTGVLIRSQFQLFF
jgi:hypothetical protein